MSVLLVNKRRYAQRMNENNEEVKEVEGHKDEKEYSNENEHNMSILRQIVGGLSL